MGPGSRLILAPGPGPVCLDLSPQLFLLTGREGVLDIVHLAPKLADCAHEPGDTTPRAESRLEKLRDALVLLKIAPALGLAPAEVGRGPNLHPRDFPSLRRMRGQDELDLVVHKGLPACNSKRSHEKLW